MVVGFDARVGREALDANCTCREASHGPTTKRSAAMVSETPRALDARDLNPRIKLIRS